jgi:hypothetical protein
MMLGVLEKKKKLVHVVQKFLKRIHNLVILMLFCILISQWPNGWLCQALTSFRGGVMYCAGSRLQPNFLLKPITFASQLFDQHIIVSLPVIVFIYI